MQAPNAIKALELYYTQSELSNADIRQLFNCASSTATRLKKQVQAEMAKTDIKTWLPGNVDLNTAYQMWGIDIAELERKTAKLNKLKSAGII